MAECIERDAARECIHKWLADIFGIDNPELTVLDKRINAIPAANVVARDCYDRLLAENDGLRKERPVRHGRWIVSRTDYGWNGAEFPTHCKCGQCGREVPYQDRDNYCPTCGALMDKDGDGE